MNLMTMIVIAALGLPSTRIQEGPGVSVEAVHRKMQSGKPIVLLDVRRPEEFAGETGHLEGAILLPVQELANRLDELRMFKNDTIVVYCRTDNRSRTAVSVLDSNGFAAVRMMGGITAWKAQGLPVVLEESQ